MYIFTEIIIYVKLKDHAQILGLAHFSPIYFLPLIKKSLLKKFCFI